MSDFDWPWQYKFPPFFTIQPNIETRKKQLEAWCNLLLAYQKHIKKYHLDITEAQNSELFYNKQLNIFYTGFGVDHPFSGLHSANLQKFENERRRRC